MKYLKKFDTHTEYEAYRDSQDYMIPNVSYCLDNGEWHFKKYIKPYSERYLTTEALESGTISFNIWKNTGTEYITSISYSVDKGCTWVTTNNTDDKQEHLSITVNVSKGDRILWKGIAQQTGFSDSEYGDIVGSFFSSTAKFNIYGNVMSLLYGDDFRGMTVLQDNCQLASLFYDFDEDDEKECKVVDASNLSLPATTLSTSCYRAMFRRCKLLTAAPELPATTMAAGCYAMMFTSCSSLTTAPVLPALSLTTACYAMMFNFCSKLNYVKAMFTTPPSTASTVYWLSNVSETGTFVKNSAAQWDVTGSSGIPEGWTVETVSA